MGEAFSWIGQIVEWIGSFIPHHVHVKATHMGVMFTGAKARTIEPGIHWYLPFMSEPLIWPVKRQTLNLPYQVLTTKDEREIFTSVIVTYEVEDIYKALVESFDFEDTIIETAEGAVKKVIARKEYAELLENQRNVDIELSRRIRSDIKPYGVKVISAVIKDFSKIRVYRVVGNDHTNSHQTQ